MLSMRGIAGVYVHSLFATPNDVDGVESSGSNRAINRRRFAGDPFVAPPTRDAARTLSAMKAMMRRRSSSDAFHPGADQVVLDTSPQVVGIERTGLDDAARVYVNLTGEALTVDVPAEWRTEFAIGAHAELGPYESLWIGA
jgi:sucrose phosphorylase